MSSKAFSFVVKGNLWCLPEVSFFVVGVRFVERVKRRAVVCGTLQKVDGGGVCGSGRGWNCVWAIVPVKIGGMFGENRRCSPGSVAHVKK